MNETPEIGNDPVAELSSNLALLVRSLFRAGDVTETLRAVVFLASENVDGCEFASFFSSDAATPLSSDQIAGDVDALQRRFNEGPCVDANNGMGVVYASDLTSEERWQHFAPPAAAMGIRSVLALPLVGNGAPGVLGLYSRFPLAFGIADRAKALIFATVAELALAAAHLHQDEERRFEKLQRGLSTRELIGQAQGILMERERITADQAFGMLRIASQHLNVKLRDVARDLVDTGETPQGPQNRPRSQEPE